MPQLPSSPKPIRIHFDKERLINAKSVEEMRLRLEEDVTLVRPPKVKDRIALPSSPKPVRVRYNQDDLVNCRSVEELHELMNEGFMDVRVPKQKAPGTPCDSGKLKAKIASCRSIQDLRSVLKEENIGREEAKTKTDFVRSKIPGSVVIQQQQQQKWSKRAEAFARTKKSATSSSGMRKKKSTGEAFSRSKLT